MNEPDPIQEAMVKEFATISQDELYAGNDDPDLQVVCGYAKYLKRRLDEIQAIKDYAKRRCELLGNEIERAQDWRRWKAGEAFAKLTANRKSKSIDTPWGRVGYRTISKPTVEYDPHDEEALQCWLGEHCPDALSDPRPPNPTIKRSVLAAFLSGPGAPECDLVTLTLGSHEEFYYTPSKQTEGEGDAECT